MRIRPLVLPVLAAVVVLSGPVLGYAVGARRTTSGRPDPHHVYRLDYVVSVSQPGKPTVNGAYVMNVEEGHTGDLHAGANIPLIASPRGGVAPARQDVGVRLDAHVTRVGEDLLLQNRVELSGADEDVGESGRAIRKITASDDAVVPLGKPTLVAKLEEPVSHAQYEVTVTATKLR
jgi:hypothetical protein